MPDATCTHCGEPYTPTNTNQKYCSSRCAKNHGYHRRRNAGGERQTKTCDWCDKTYATSRRMGRYCSNYCASYGNGQARLTSQLSWSHCEPCDRWLSRGRCHELHGESTALNWRYCLRCALWYCRSNGCPQASTHERKAPPDKTPRRCHSCGTPYVPRSSLSAYCSNQCAKREAKARRRDKTRNDPWSPATQQGRIRRYAIYERDRWRCQLCGEKVKRNLPSQHPREATIDHILPVSLGGQHVESNLQLAHRSCNSEKRDRVWGDGEQLRLAV